MTRWVSSKNPRTKNGQSASALSNFLLKIVSASIEKKMVIIVLFSKKLLRRTEELQILIFSLLWPMQKKLLQVTELMNSEANTIYITGELIQLLVKGTYFRNASGIQGRNL